MRKAILMMLLAVVSSNAMAGWVKVGTTELGTVYADPATIYTNGQNVKMWSLLNSKVGGSVKTQSEYDCHGYQLRTLVIYLYAGKMGRGKPTRIVVHTGHWESASHESAAEAKLIFACDSPRVGWYDSPPATSSATTTPRGLPPDVEALLASPHGPVLAELTVEQRIQLAINAKKMEADMVLLRREYANKLRDKFLDDGMDIKVSTSGTSSNRLYFKYALFNDVWVHKFQKGSLIDEIKEMGFKKVDFDDGYDYHVYFTFK
jgi:hypothetical protein